MELYIGSSFDPSKRQSLGRVEDGEDTETNRRGETRVLQIEKKGRKDFISQWSGDCLEEVDWRIFRNTLVAQVSPVSHLDFDVSAPGSRGRPPEDSGRPENEREVKEKVGRVE